MVAADVTEYVQVNNPTTEVVVLEATDTETYTSRKFQSVKGGSATLWEDTGSLSIPVSLAVSGNVVTIHCTGLSDQAVCLTLHGVR